jgi:hypothetical protein
MPYIDKERRAELKEQYDWDARTAGELNYVLSQHVYLNRTDTGRHPSYALYNEVIGVLECLKLEVYRRLVAPYEDTKLEENGDVFHR